MNRISKKIIGAIIDVVAAIIVMVLWFILTKNNSNDLWLKSFLLFCISVGYLIAWIKRTHSFKSLFLFFFLYSTLTNAGQLFLSVFSIDIIYTFSVFDITETAVMSKAIDYQTICTVLMCTGALLAHRLHSVPTEVKKQSFDEQSGLLRKEGWSTQDMLFVVLGIVYCFLNLIKLGSRVDQEYFDAFNSGEVQSAPFLLQLAFYIFMYYACFTHRVKGDPFRKVIVAVNIMVGISNMLFGSRNVIIPLVFGMVFLWSYDFKKLSLKKIIGIFLLVIFAFYILGAFVNIRRVSLSELSFSFIMDSLFGASIADQLVISISEMGGSLRVLTTTIQEIDQGIIASEPTFLYTVLKGIVPKVDILEFAGITEPVRWGLSVWITDSHGSTAGWGYSMYAEAYYNFKEFGCIFMGLFGYFYVWLESKIEKWYLNGHTVMASGWLFAAAYIIFLARADSILFVSRLRYALYLGILCMCLRGRVRIPETRFTIRKS